MNQLEKWLKERIEREGSISFRDYMETALYHPKFGYYEKRSNQIGCQGDYFTSPKVGKLFGAFIALWISELKRSFFERQLTLVEMGAGSGELAYDILSTLKASFPETYDQSNYLILEKSSSLREREKSFLNPFVKENKVGWINSLDELSKEPIEGVFLSNELVDSFPVHLVEQTKKGFQEIYLTLDEKGQLAETLKAAPPEVQKYFEELNIQLKPPYRTEVNLEAVKWLQEVAAGLKRGFVVTIDYGFEAGELYAPHRSQGTLMCYHRHQVMDSPYTNPGEQDITSHVNFSALIHWGNQFNLKTCFWGSQSQFLLLKSLTEKLPKLLQEDSDAFNRLANQLKMLTHPNTLGEVMKVLVQHNLEKGYSEQVEKFFSKAL